MTSVLNVSPSAVTATVRGKNHVSFAVSNALTLIQLGTSQLDYDVLNMSLNCHRNRDEFSTFAALDNDKTAVAPSLSVTGGKDQPKVVVMWYQIIEKLLIYQRTFQNNMMISKEKKQCCLTLPQRRRIMRFPFSFCRESANCSLDSLFFLLFSEGAVPKICSHR
jgi:hypothetical protein